jgi:hypothetical protein
MLTLFFVSPAVISGMGYPGMALRFFLNGGGESILWGLLCQKL